MKTIKEWLETIADPIIRERALSQINKNRSHWPEDGMVYSLDDALDAFNVWCETEEGDNYWYKIWLSAIDGKLETREAPEEKPEINTAKGNFNSWYYNQDKYTKTEQGDGTIILKPKKKVKVWIEVGLVNDVTYILRHSSKKELEESIELGKQHNETLLEVIEREYEI